MRYFIDTCIIIDFMNKKDDAIQTITDLANNDDTELFINRLILTEALRTIPQANTKVFREAQATLDSFDLLDINHSIYEQSIALSRFARSKGVSLKGDCELIDFINFITAQHYGLTMLSNDKDIPKLEAIYPAFLSSQASS
jgi:predicted nucleic acid-binding protein